MTKTLAVVITSLAILAASAPAHAATPTGGTITKSKRSLHWQGATFIVSEPAPDPITNTLYAPDCHTDSMCDHFALKVTLGDNAQIDVRITTARPNPPGTFEGIQSLQPITGDDYDLYVYDPSGRLVSGMNGATEKGNEHVTIAHRKRFNGKAYDIAVRAWAVAPGSTYQGAVRVLSTGR